MYLPSDLRLEWHGDGPLFELDLNKCRDQNVGTIRVTPWVIIYVRPAFLSQIRHWCKSLSFSMFIKFVENDVPINKKKVEGSLSKHLCMW